MYARVLKICTVMVPTNVCTCTEDMYSNGTNKCMHVY